MQPPTDPARQSSPAAPVIRDRRVPPTGVLPRHVQMWLLAGLALVIVMVILITGRTPPSPRSATVSTASAVPTSATADRIRSYQRQLADEQARQEQLEQQALAAQTRTTSPRTTATPPAAASDPIAEDQHRREYQSLFADNLSFTRRANDAPAPPVRDAVAGNVEPRTPSPTPTTAAPPTGATPVVADREHAPDHPSHQEQAAVGPRLRLSEGTVIEAALVNRLDGTFAGPALGLVTTPVYSQDRQHVLIPAGARVIGSASPVQAWGESRLAVTFHRLVMPDAHTYSLDRFTGWTQIGETGLRDQVNRHYLQVFGASLAIGAISGLAQYNTRVGVDTTFSDAYRQAAGASLATSSSRVLDRYLNLLPTITIREGTRMKVYLTNDLELPAYDDRTGGQP